MIGMLITPIKVQLGPIANGLVIAESFVPSPKLQFPGLDDLMKRYQAKAAELKTDALGYAFVPFGYAAGQILAQAVTETKSLDHDKLAAYIHANSSRPWSARSRSARTANGSKPRQFLTQFQNIEPNNARSVPRRRQAADPVAARVQDRRDDLSLRRRAEEVADPHSHEKPPTARRRLSFLANVPRSFAKNESFANRNRFAQENFALTRSLRSRAELSRNAPMFLLMSRFVRKERIDPRIEIDLPRDNFPLMRPRWRACATSPSRARGSPPADTAAASRWSSPCPGSARAAASPCPAP